MYSYLCQQQVADIFERKEVKVVDDVNTQPKLTEAWQRAVWRKLREISELTAIQAQELETLRLRVKRLEAEIKELTDTQQLN